MSQDKFENRRRKYENTVLQRLRQMLLDPHKQSSRPRAKTGKVWVDEIYLDTSQLEHDVVVLFRDPDRPQCKFGFGAAAVEAPYVLDEASSPYLSFTDAAECHAVVLWANFEEEIYAVGCGLPKLCASDGITWI